MAYSLNFTVQNGNEVSTIKVDEEAVEKLFPNATPEAIVASVKGGLEGYIREKIATVVSQALIEKFIEDHITVAD